jgi:serine/threonine-protein kinase PpkA
VSLPEIPGYQLDREIGAGGMARVYLATQISLDRKVALKVMAPALVADPAFSKRFLREARTLAGLTHPNIVAVYDVGATDSQLHYFAMQHLDNSDMAARIARGIPETDVVRVVTAIAKALGFAHQRGVVHRDVTPGNIMFDSANNPVLTDFGIARSQHGSTRITHTGVSIGTSSYMSPEQARGGEVDQRSDLYSLGALAFEALTGHPPYRGADGFAVAYAHVFEPIPRLPAHVSHWQPFIDKILAKDPNERFDNADQFAMALSDVPVSAQRIVPQRALPKSPATVQMAPPDAAASVSAQTRALKNVDAMPKPGQKPLAPSADRPTVPRGTARPEIPAAPPKLDSLLAEFKKKAPSAAAAPSAGNRSFKWLAAALLAGAGIVAGGYWLMQRKPIVTVAQTPPSGTVKAPVLTPVTPIPTPAVVSDPALVPSLDPTLNTGLDPLVDPAVDPALSLETLPPLNPVGNDFGPPTRALFVKPMLDAAAVAVKKNQCFTPRGAVDLFRLALSIDAVNAAAPKGVQSCFATFTASVDALLAAERADIAAFLPQLTLVQKSALVGGAKSPEAQLITAQRARIVSELLSRTKPLEAKWQGDAAALLYADVLLLEPANALAIAGAKRAPGLGKPGFSFSDVLKTGGKAPAMRIVSGGQIALRDAKGAGASAQVSSAFAVAKLETTLGDYRRFVSASGYRGGAQGCNNKEGFAMFVAKDRTWQKPGFDQTDSSPVVCVDFNDAQAYVRWLSAQTGESYRLLSEAEWQLLAKNAPKPGCSAGNIGDSSYGKQFEERKTYTCSDNFGATAPGGKFGADANGLSDLTGNVREWVADCWNASLGAHPRGGGPWQAGRCGSRVAMGTAWVSEPSETSVINRADFSSDARNNTVGFRVARDVAQSP